MTSLIYNLPENPNSITNVLLIDNRVANYQTFVDSVNTSTFPVVYSIESSKAELLNLLTSIFTVIPRIGLVFDGSEKVVFLENESFFAENGSDNSNVAFIIQVIQQFAVKNIDYLACNTLQYADWNAYYGRLSSSTGVVVGASNDATGNIKYGGDWVMESTCEDIESVYFTQSIEYYQYLLSLTGSPIVTYSTDTSYNVTLYLSSSYTSTTPVIKFDISYVFADANLSSAPTYTSAINTINITNSGGVSSATVLINGAGTGGRKIFYKVVAIAASGSPLTTTSNSNFIIPTICSEVQSITVTPNDDQSVNSYTLSWSQPTSAYDTMYITPRSNNLKFVTSYKIVYTDNTLSSSPVTISGLSSLQYVFNNNLTRGHNYTFNVYAVNGFGQSPNSIYSYNIPAYIPDTPANIVASYDFSNNNINYVSNHQVGNQSVTLSWNKPYDEGDAISQYVIRAYIDNTNQNITYTTNFFTINNGVVSAIINQFDDLSYLINGSKYSFTVTSVNNIGLSIESVKSNQVVPVGIPTLPQNVVANYTLSDAGINYAKSHSVDLSWNAPIDNGGNTITSYVITPYIGATAQSTVTVSGTSYSKTVTDLSNGTSYTFKVQAVNIAGSSAESVASGAVVPANISTAPQNVIANYTLSSGGVNYAKSHSVDLSWNAPADIGGEPILSYIITPYIGTSAQSTTTVSGTSGSATITDLSNGSSYTFNVRAVNVMGTSVESVASGPVVPANISTAPRNVVANYITSNAGVNYAKNQAADLTWNAPADIGGEPILSYIITPYIGTTAQPTTTIPGTYLSVTIVGLTNGTSYTFTVKAVNVMGTSIESVASGQVVPATNPNAPVNIVATPNYNQNSAIITWSSDLSNNGAPILGYKITSTPGNFTTTITDGPLDCSGVITGLTNGTSYTFTVHSINAIGNSIESVASNSIIPASVPNAPVSVSGVHGNQIATISWVLDLSNGNAVDNVSVFYSGSNIPLTYVDVSANLTSKIINGLTNGITYTFYVESHNVAGFSNASSSVQAIPSTIPNAPSNISATPRYDSANTSSATVSWSVPSNNGATIQNYRIVCNENNSLATTVNGASSTSGIVTGLTNGQSYTFYVTATNLDGTSSHSSNSNSIIPGYVPNQVTSGFYGETDGDRGNDVDISFSWVAPYDQGYQITQYDISYNNGQGSSGFVSSIGSPATPGKGIHALVRGTTYTVYITAINSVGRSIVSPQFSYTVPYITPDAPSSIAVSNYTSIDKDQNSITITWNTPYPEGAALTSYEIGYTNGTQSGFISGISVSSQTVGSSNSYTITSANQISADSFMRGTSFTFSVYARNVGGRSSAGTVTYAIPAIVPNTVIGLTGLSYDFSNNTVPITWSIPYNQGSSITGYVLTYNDGAGHYGTVSTTATTTNVNLPNLLRGVQFKISVYAINSVGNSAISSIFYFVPSIPCFKEDSKILTDKGYKLVQDLRQGDLVKTFSQGFVPVDMIGYSTIYNPGDARRIKHRLYKCTPEKYPELSEDLIITGCHAILVDKDLTPDELAKSKEILGEVYLTENCYRIPACADDNADPYLEQGTFNIYHIALENEDYYTNYGVYANGSDEKDGLLVESCSKRYLKELSNMTLLL